MVCRVRIRLRVDDKVFEGRALLNSGFESDTPDIVIPVNVARDLGLWPPKTNVIAMLDTGGGEVVSPYYQSSADLELILEDRASKTVKVSIIVNPHVDEVVLSDYVVSLLNIILLDFKKGFWRLSDDPPDRVREPA